MYCTIFIIVLLVIGTNSEGSSEDRIAKIEENVATISKSLQLVLTKMASIDGFSPMLVKLNDTDLEERVQALEFQMENVQEEITNISDDVDVLTSEVTIIHADQVVQDERLLDVEDEVELVGRGFVALEENVSALDASNSQLNESVNDLDSRVDDLESSGGNGNGTSAPSIVFGANNVVTPIDIDSIIVFPEVAVNLGDGYDNETGEFTVPQGGAGVYFLFFYTSVDNGEHAEFSIRHNGNALCYATGDHHDLGEDWAATSCGVVSILNEDDVVTVVYDIGTDTTPTDVGLYTGFSGFRIRLQ